MTIDKKHLYYDNYNANFYKYGKDLIKIFKNYIPEQLENQVTYNYLIHEELNNHIILPTDLLYGKDNWFIGYKMDFVDGIDLGREIVNNNLSFEDKIFLMSYILFLKKLYWAVK